MSLDLSGITKVDKLFTAPDYFIVNVPAVQHFADTLCGISYYLIVLFTVLELSRQFLVVASGDGELKLLKPFLKICIFMVFLFSVTLYDWAFRTFFCDPITAIAGMIKESAVLSKLGAAEAVKKNIENGGNTFGSIGSLSPSTLLSSLAFFGATIGVFFFSLVQQIYIAILYVVGPLVIPFFIFEPFSDVFMNWVKRVIGTLMWSVFGILMLAIIWSSGMWSKATELIGGGDVVMSTVLCIAVAVCCFKIPGFASQIVGAGLDVGLTPQAMGGKVAQAGVVTGKAIATGGVSLGGDAAAMGGQAISAAGKI